ncbi:MAG: hypothetical protein ACI4CT_07850 [Lachnospiraceae bacterium]
MMNDDIQKNELVIEGNTIYEIDPNCRVVSRNGRRQAVLLKKTNQPSRNIPFLVLVLLTLQC